MNFSLLKQAYDPANQNPEAHQILFLDGKAWMQSGEVSISVPSPWPIEGRYSFKAIYDWCHGRNLDGAAVVSDGKSLSISLGSVKRKFKKSSETNTRLEMAGFDNTAIDVSNVDFSIFDKCSSVCDITDKPKEFADGPIIDEGGNWTSTNGSTLCRVIWKWCPALAGLHLDGKKASVLSHIEKPTVARLSQGFFTVEDGDGFSISLRRRMSIKSPVSGLFKDTGREFVYNTELVSEIKRIPNDVEIRFRGGISYEDKDGEGSVENFSSDLIFFAVLNSGGVLSRIFDGGQVRVVTDEKSWVVRLINVTKLPSGRVRSDLFATMKPSK
jgi:hypothetical protein